MIGRPPKYDKPEDMQEAIDGYFADREKPTISGLCYHLGFVSRQSFYDYEKNPDFSYTIKMARMRIAEVYESLLHGGQCAGAIFALKNFGWSDKQEIEYRELDIDVEIE